jgi:uncharacterized protein (TIGR02231 family)
MFRYPLPALALLLALPVLHAQELPRRSRVVKVVLYRGDALVTREVPVAIQGQAGEVIVPDLPAAIVPESLFAEGEEGLEVRSVRYVQTAVVDEPREDIRRLDAEIEALSDRIQAGESQRSLVQAEQLRLDSLHNFVAPTASVELSKGVLDPEAVERLVSFAFERRRRLGEEQLEIEKSLRAARRELEAAQRERAALAGAASRQRREARIFVQLARPGPGMVRLSYLVTGCTWLPQYNVRCRTGAPDTVLEANATIQQMSGEDWSDVELVLSTATPAMNAAMPPLAPFSVAMRAPAEVAQSRDLQEATGRLSDLLNRQKEAKKAAINPSDGAQAFYNTWTLNAIAMECQTLELNEDTTIFAAARKAAEAKSGLSVDYRILGPVTLASRVDPQLVRIARLELAGRQEHVAAPLLTNHVYRMTVLHNTTGLDLLAGEVAVYLDGRYVGRTDIDSVARGQSVELGLGVDPQLRARRDPGERKESVQGGNKVTTLRHLITIENYKNEEVAIRLLDRVPYSENKDALRVILGEMDAPLSTHPDYARFERPYGILRWDLSIAARAIGDSAKSFSFSYSLEHDRNLAPAAVSAAENKRAQEEFEALLRQRQVR